MNQLRSDPVTGRYLPVQYPEEMPFWEAAREHRLVLQTCTACGKTRFPIGAICPACLSPDHDWTQMSGLGVVHNYVVYHKAWSKYLETRVPYAVVQVELPEGPRLTTNLLGIPASAVRIGMEVEADWEDVTDEITLIQFRPRAARQSKEIR